MSELVAGSSMVHEGSLLNFVRLLVHDVAFVRKY
jgi:hypothetical protein